MIAEQKRNTIPWQNRHQHFRVTMNFYQTKYTDNSKPNKYNRPKKSPDLCSTMMLKQEENGENGNRYRYYKLFECRGYNLNSLYSTEH